MGTDSSNNREVAGSLDADERLLPFLPALLEDLWALGFTPEPMLRLLKRCDFTARRGLRVLDLGCGKGAGLIRLAQEFGWYGDGVDLVPEFIEDARAHAAQCGVSDRVHFEVADIAQVVHQGDEIDLILFGFDADGLGTLEQSLTVVTSQTSESGTCRLGHDLDARKGIQTWDCDVRGRDKERRPRRRFRRR